MALAEQRHEHTQTALKCKLEESRQQYAALEDEFRMALTIEAARFNEVASYCYTNDALQTRRDSMLYIARSIRKLLLISLF